MGDRLFSWIDVEGIEWPLNGETNYQVIQGPEGLYGIPVSLVTQDVPMFPGTTLKYVQLLPGNPKLPIVVYAATEEGLDDARRQLKWAVTSSRGQGRIRHTANDGTVREINCLLSKGFEGNEQPGQRSLGALWLALEFVAPDPFWYDTDFQQVPFATSGGSAFLGSTAFLPIHLSPGGVIGSATLENSGDAVAWPIWTLTGPATSLLIVNNTTGDTLSLPNTRMAALADSTKTITIDTSPVTGKTILREDGSKHFEYLDPTTALWPLAVGNNSISVTIGGSGAGTLLTLQYKRRYEGV